METLPSVIPPKTMITSSQIFAYQKDLYELDPQDGSVRQHYPLAAGNKLTLSPERIYLSDQQTRRIKALAIQGGALLWEREIPAASLSAPTLKGESLYVSCIDGHLLALSAQTGTILWIQNTTYCLSTSPVVTHHLVCVVSDNQPHTLSAFRKEDGRLLWSTTFPSRPSLSPTFSEESIYLIANNACHALQAKDGSPVWLQPFDGHALRPPIIEENALYLSSYQPSFSLSPQENLLHLEKIETIIRALRTTDGSLLWQKHLGEFSQPGYTTPLTVHSQASLYLGTPDGYLLAVQIPGGLLLWKAKTGGNGLSQPVVHGGIVYIGADDGCISAFQENDGSCLWRSFISTAHTTKLSISLS